MILSVRHGFLYFAMPKTATTSIESLLGAYGDITLARTAHYKHIDCTAAKERYSTLFSTYYPYERFFKFGVVRDPVSWIVSWYNFRSRPELADPRSPIHKNYLGPYSLDEFVEELGSTQPRSFARIGTQSAFYGLSTGELGVDALVRHDHLREDLATISKHLPVDLSRGLSSTKANESPPRLSRADVSAATQNRILQLFEKDLKLYTRAEATLSKDPAAWDPSNVRDALALLKREYRDDIRETHFNKWKSRAKFIARPVLRVRDLLRKP
jgi:Sulfotransferase family